MKTNRKSYNQVCPLTTALDYVGDRWTILIVRELLGGAARFNEIRDGLPTIAGNLLADRLRRLEEDGLIRQMKVHNTSVYALTEQGADIRTALEELAMWGARQTRVAPVLYERSLRAIAMALQSVVVRAGDALPTERFVIEVEVEEEFIEIILDQSPTVTVRPSRDPDVRISITYEGLSSVLRGKDVDRSIFTHISGNEVATKYLIEALR
jgi:DNA-binding HxlR family transcriptional regulator